MTTRKRILYLAPCWPEEKTFGGQLRVKNIARALEQVGEVRIIVVRFDDDHESTRHEFGVGRQVEEFVELKVAPPRSLVSSLRCGFDARYLSVQGQIIAPAARDRVLGRLQEFDVVWLHHLSVANAFGVWRWENSVMDVDDIPSMREQNLVRSETHVTKRARSVFRSFSAQRRERQFPNRFTVLSVCSEKDRSYLNLNMPVHVIPNGFERLEVEPVRPPVLPPRIGLVGTFGYTPNMEGCRWFVERCWKQVRERVPGVRLRLVGRGSDGEGTPRDASIDNLGWVAETTEEIATWSVMIVPIKSGSGTRVKIAEGFARKCPMVSTSLGAYGYELRSGEQLVLADTAEDFAAACIELLENPGKAAAMAERAHRAFLEKWTWDAIAPRVWETVEDCFRRLPAGTA